MWAICDIAIHTIFSKTSNYDTRDFSLDARIPSMYYQPQPEGFQNTRIYIPPDMYSTYNSGTSNTKKTGIVIPVSARCIVDTYDMSNEQYSHAHETFYFQTTRKVLRSEDQATTAGTVSPAATSPTPPNTNNTGQQTNTVSEPKGSSVSEDDGLDENKEPPAKRLRTRAAAAAVNHQ